MTPRIALAPLLLVAAGSLQPSYPHGVALMVRRREADHVRGLGWALASVTNNETQPVRIVTP